MVLINGEEKNAAGMTVMQCLEAEGLAPERVAVMINGEILPKSDYSATVIEDGSEVDIVGFVGGG
ncbi:MAG: sulfur carrier protein ThiS [Oscillospiraceae bacterium]